jgi:hypothetical protein
VIFARYGTAVPLARQVAGLPSFDDRITADWSAQNAFRPRLFPFGAAVRWKLLAGGAPHPESVNTKPYRFPLASPLLISMA